MCLYMGIWTDVCVRVCYQTQVRLLAAPESMPNKQLLVERKVACAQYAGKLDDGGLHIPHKPPPKVLLHHEVFKGKKGGNLSESLRWGSELWLSPTAVDLSTSCHLSLDVILFSLSQRLLMGRHGRDLVISYFLHFTDTEGGNRQNRLHLESKTASWAGLWTLSSMPSIYGNDIPTGKPGPLDGRAPGLVPRFSVA